MIENIINLLEIAKEAKKGGEYTDIALGKYKFPNSLVEAFQQFKRELWQK
tara:strand:+ start:1334 stop:1483 length:150 start_codon:yes stop_codon:yes gene_type:complete